MQMKHRFEDPFYHVLMYIFFYLSEKKREREEERGGGAGQASVLQTQTDLPRCLSSIQEQQTICSNFIIFFKF